MGEELFWGRVMKGVEGEGGGERGNERVEKKTDGWEKGKGRGRRGRTRV